ncbi:SecY subunit of chloroplast preprotein translocase [Chloropicon primus]|nr:SecY subunit of chloroplast preprotein translocase [Chloropicon primus]
MRGEGERYSPLERLYRWLEDHDLPRRAAITVAAVLLSRLCFLLPLPGLDRRFLAQVLEAGPLGALKDPFGDLLQTPGNVFQLGFGAMIFSSIVVQVLVSTLPALKQKTREGGTGEAFIKNLGLYIFAAAAAVQGLVTTHLLGPFLLAGTTKLDLLATLVCGSMILKTMCTLIDNFGVGDGFLNILVANIAAEYAVVLRFIVSRFLGGHIAAGHLAGLAAAVALCVLASVWLTASTDNLPIRYYSREGEDEGDKEAYLPFKINPTGMQPIIIASYLLHLPSQVALALGGGWHQVGSFFSRKVVYYPLYFSLLYFSAFIDINETSKEISLYLGKIGAIIPGVRPGERTTEFVESFRRRTIRKGAGLLAVLGTFSIATEVYFRRQIGISLSLTSMLLLVSAFMQVRRQVTSYKQAPRLERAIEAYESLINSSMTSPFK